MTKEKWNEIYKEECRMCSDDFMKPGLSGPENWERDRSIIMKFIKNVDMATEVYKMESEK